MEKYRQGVAVVILNSQNLVWVGERSDVIGNWQMPQGGVDDDEDLLNAACREIYEETGISKNKLEFITKLNIITKYDFPNYIIPQLGKYMSQFKGQSHHWFVFRFLGKDHDIKLDNNLEETQEFIKWKWEKLSNLINLSVEFRQHCYRQVCQELMTIDNLDFKKL